MIACVHVLERTKTFVDLLKIAYVVWGVRSYSNAMQNKTNKRKKTIYVCQANETTNIQNFGIEWLKDLHNNN